MAKGKLNEIATTAEDVAFLHDINDRGFSVFPLSSKLRDYLIAEGYIGVNTMEPTTRYALLTKGRSAIERFCIEVK